MEQSCHSGKGHWPNCCEMSSDNFLIYKTTVIKEIKKQVAGTNTVQTLRHAITLAKAAKVWMMMPLQ